MNLKKKIITPFARFFLLLCLIVFFACAGSLDTYRGKTAWRISHRSVADRRFDGKIQLHTKAKLFADLRRCRLEG